MTRVAVPALATMPPRAPLEMPAQAFRRARINAPPSARDALPWRLALFLPALASTLLLVSGLHGWFASMGMSGLEWLLLTMIGLTFVWVTLSVSTIGLVLPDLLTRRDASQNRQVSPTALEVALLVPIYNETASGVFGNAAAMLNDLARCKSAHRYTLFILSDTQKADIAAEEQSAFALLQAGAPEHLRVHYRRRQQNTDRKVGNLFDWITGWGAAYDAMVVLDADSLMTGRAIDQMADALSADPETGLIQSCPMLIGAETLFARLQQFSNVAYGWLLAEGLAKWSRDEGNYWGHNAIIRTRAFAASAGLPRLSKRRGRSEMIFSHDFVEAGLLRRAGWRVRFVPRLPGSFEETPGTLVDYILRDRRWCRGNLQHLRLIGASGLHPVSRFHLLQGAMSYLLSPAWFFLLVVWFLLGKDSETNVIRYFNEANPLFPDWPPAISHIDSAVFLVIMYAMLLAPKLVSAGVILTQSKATRLYGGRVAFTAAFLAELTLSIAYAPIMMIQQTQAVLRTALGRAGDWAPQRRDAQAYPVRDLIRFHWMESLLGLVLTFGLASGLVSLWLLPIATSLVLAVPLSALSALPVQRYLPRALQMNSPMTLREPGIVGRARQKREWFRAALHAGQIPAE